MNGYQHDRNWSDAFIPALRHIVGPLLLHEAPLEVDREQAADLVVLTGRNMTVACRVRRPGYAHRYPWDFTIRARRENGSKTELAKIVEGWADWLVYAHADENFGLGRWFVLDLDAFRAALIRQAAIRDRQETSNGDGTSFLAYDVREIPGLVIAASVRIPDLALAPGAYDEPAA